MSIEEFLKEKAPFLFLNLVLFIFAATIMILIDTSVVIIFLTFCIWFVPLVSYIIIELIKHKRYYDEIQGILENLEKKYLLSEVINEPNFIDGRIIYNILKETCRYMNENVKYYKDMQHDYREYIETWVHEIKTPIASTKLIIENNNNQVTDRINIQVNRIETFIEQVLYYSRSNDANKDYIIKEVELNKVVMNVIKRNSRDFINKKIKFDVKNIDKTIYSDIQWIEFILNQIILNAIKYSKERDGKIAIYSSQNSNSIILTIEDNGVGIVEKDINKVFEKGFTGENGRKFGKATGMGLYLCKKLCNKLGLGINIESTVNEGTKVHINFPLSNFMNF
ncbi:sensor histidine kinase [Clostridium weizhouense]|uniref:histidine kinase n=1 Tax=Clostridium weizhouense TaxID=2859781 RepID=A0ABS7AN32_9CLOT|nr:sensor histidine kinase [Clostridium weizhouense]MBW6410080.1 sensor histidine kinase [Clostridium weizhouense]